MAANSYETMLVFSVANGEEGAKALYEKFKALIEKNGTINSVDEWGTRKLAYLIDVEAEGFYVVTNFSAEPQFIAELDRRAKITDGVLRILTVRK